VWADDQFAFFQGICHIQLGDFIEAKNQFNRSAQALFTQPIFWKTAGETYWPIAVSIFSNRLDILPAISQELNLYRNNDYRGNSPVASFSYGLLEFLYPTGWEINKSIQILKKSQRFKIVPPWGKALEALLNKNSLNFETAIEDLLKVHEGMAKHGSLRYSAEGLLCLSAMSLVYIAIQREMSIEIENDYFSMEYLKFIMEGN
jgi:hypothetical protein